MADAIIFDFRHRVLFFFGDVARFRACITHIRFGDSFRTNEGIIYGSSNCFVVVDNIM
jgi:hypothetical protein